MQKCILIIDKAKEYLDFLSSNLVKDGYRVITAGNGASALELVKQIPDLIILDIVLPDMNGLDIVRELKRTTTTSTIPIFVLTSKETEADEIICLEVGSDDFIVKPVQIQRLLARIRAIIRQRDKIQSTFTDEEVVSFEGLEIRIPDYTISYGNTTLPFPRKEFEILIHLFRHRGKVVTREAISRAVWGSSIQVTNRTIDVHIGRIRKKLGRYAHLIGTVHGIGYRCQIP
jgi:two-component system, OmpR family, alkaline phosphatase synthesis response regulator PhoP